MVVVVVVLITIGFLHDCISLIAGSGDRRKDRDAATKPQSQHQLHQLLQVIVHFLSFSCSYLLCSYVFATNFTNSLSASFPVVLVVDTFKNLTLQELGEEERLGEGQEPKRKR